MVGGSTTAVFTPQEEIEESEKMEDDSDSDPEYEDAEFDEFVDADFETVEDTDQRGLKVVDDEAVDGIRENDRIQVEMGARAGETQLVVGMVESFRRGTQVMTVSKGDLEPDRWDAEMLSRGIERGGITVLRRRSD